MNKKFLIFPLLTTFITSCAESNVYYNRVFSFFDTTIVAYQYEGSENYLTKLNDIYYELNNLTDNYKAHGNGVYELNSDNNVHEISEDLYNILELALSYKESFSGKFNPLVGSLAKKWQESIENKQVLASNIISEEVEKINNSSLVLSKQDNKFYAQRIGEAELDLGAISKGYALDKTKEYFDSKELSKFAVNCGASSILLGKSNETSSDFRVILKDLKNKCFFAQDIFIGTSGVSERGAIIDGVQYSHIVNPIDGSAINNYDMAYVVGDNGALCDVLSTTFMLSSLDEIRTYETQYNVKTLLYKNGEIVYLTDGFELENYHG